MINDEILLKKKLLRPDEVADILRVDTRTVRRMVESGDLSAIRAGFQWRIKTDSLKRLMGDEEK